MKLLQNLHNVAYNKSFFELVSCKYMYINVYVPFADSSVAYHFITIIVNKDISTVLRDNPTNLKHGEVLTVFHTFRQVIVFWNILSICQM